MTTYAKVSGGRGVFLAAWMKASLSRWRSLHTGVIARSDSDVAIPFP
jgi:hypothetical protein